MRTFVFVLALLALVLPSQPVLALSFGAVGDSLTDEYLGNSTPGQLRPTDLPARSWVQILAERRGLDFGSFETDGSVRGEPRLEGYQYNYARSSAQALASSVFPFSEILSAVGQAQLLAPHVSAAEVDTVFLGIGSNDILRHANPDDPTFHAALVAAIMSAVDVLEAAGPATVIVHLIPDLSAAGNAINGLLSNAAIGRGLDVTSLFAFVARPGDPHFDPGTGLVTVGGVQFAFGSTADFADTVPLALADPGAPCDSFGDCGTLTYASAWNSHDGLHPGTIVQGLMANEFLRHINANLGAGVPLLTDEELLAVPEPGRGLLGLVGWFALCAAHRLRGVLVGMVGLPFAAGDARSDRGGRAWSGSR